MPRYVLDFEGFQVDSVFYPLEVAVVDVHTRLCWMLYITYDHEIYSPSVRYQQHLHHMCWKDGTISYEDATVCLRRLLHFAEVYVKDLQKANFIRNWLNVCVTEITNAPSYKHMHDCINEHCRFHVSIHCARRKAFELIKYVLR